MVTTMVAAVRTFLSPKRENATSIVPPFQSSEKDPICANHMGNRISDTPDMERAGKRFTVDLQ